MSTILFGFSVLSAITEWVAIYKSWRKAEYVAKPGMMIFLFAWFIFNGEWHGMLAWFGAGILLSLTGDIFLLFSNENRWFLFGLGNFLLAHIAYILGFNSPRHL